MLLPLLILAFVIWCLVKGTLGKYIGFATMRDTLEGV